MPNTAAIEDAGSSLQPNLNAPNFFWLCPTYRGQKIQVVN